MDRNFDIDDFEQLLKERSDEFKMYPAKRVWYSIYNNIHPGKKWPSVAMCITLIAILLLVGYLNTNNKNSHFTAVNSAQPSQEFASVNLSSSFYNPFLEKNILSSKNTEAAFTNLHSTTLINTSVGKTKLPATFNSNNTVIKKDTYTSIADNNTALYSKPILTAIKPIAENKFATITLLDDGHLAFAATTNKFQPISDEKNKVTIKNDIADSKNERNSKQQEIQLNETIAFIALSNLNDIKNNAFSLPNTLESNEKNIVQQEVNILSDEDKAWVENYALYNRPAPKKWVGKLRSQMYITPSVVYRQLKSTVTTDQDINRQVTQHPSFGVEVGAGIMYPLLKSVKIKTGLQLNFTQYNSDGFGNTHPSATSLTMNTTTGQHYQVFRSTPYSNNDGITALQLHNETFQISIPMGLDVKLAGTENLQWYAGATIQPTYVIGGQSFLISSDKRNYVKETSMLNRWNLNAGFETYISYKTNKGYSLQFGPQYRMQLFTTNSTQYSIQEKLTNYGLKFGISKLIK